MFETRIPSWNNALGEQTVAREPSSQKETNERQPDKFSDWIRQPILMGWLGVFCVLERVEMHELFDEWRNHDDDHTHTDRDPADLCVDVSH